MKLGFIGCGNMASAMIGGMIAHKVCVKEEIIGSCPSEMGRLQIQDMFGIQVTADNREVVRKSDIIFIAVKPQYYETVLSEMKTVEKEGKVFVSIAPGKTLEWMEKCLGGNAKIVRTMPNTPALVGEGMTAVCANTLVAEEEMQAVLRLLEATGRVEVISESLMDVVVGVSGSSPAYVFLFLEALADAAVAEGMPRAQAYTFAAQAVMGSAKMLLETGKHPGELKDMVCSPGGTTIQAVRVLEDKGLRGTVFEAAETCIQKAREM